MVIYCLYMHIIIYTQYFVKDPFRGDALLMIFNQYLFFYTGKKPLKYEKVMKTLQ